MIDDFEDHCWKDVVTPDILEIYACYKRKIFVGPAPALLAIDLYELVYRGGPHPPHKIAKDYPALVATMPMRRSSRRKTLHSRTRGAPANLLFDRGRAQRQPPRLRKRYQARETRLLRHRIMPSDRSSSRNLVT